MQPISGYSHQRKHFTIEDHVMAAMMDEEIIYMRKSLVTIWEMIHSNDEWQEQKNIRIRDKIIYMSKYG